MAPRRLPVIHPLLLRVTRRTTAALLAAALLFSGSPAPSLAAVDPDRTWFDAARSIELLGEVYREVTDNYVDQVDVNELMFAGIDGMLAGLDPFSAFLDESESAELDELTTGHYAGIGITIGMVSGDLYIMSVIEGNPASMAGLRVGDRIVRVDGRKVGKMPIDEVRSLIKGISGSTVRLGVDRPGLRGDREYLLKRAEVRVSTVSYAGLFGPVGYISIESFGERTVEELNSSLRTLRQQARSGNTPLQGVVLDLRGNPGGLLSTAVEVAGAFLEKGSTVVSTRGRGADAGQAYVTRSAPLVPDLPLALLIDGDSASASEIVAGAIQELDRGVVLGAASFGKGLVQSVIQLPYDHQLKLTTAKYYTPSGRLIQKTASHEPGGRKLLPEGSSLADSTTVYYTANRRKVYGGGGIRPDLVVAAQEHSGYEQALDRQGLFFTFANRYRARHESVPAALSAGTGLLGEFNRFVRDERFTYRTRPQQQLDSLRVLLKLDHDQADDKQLDAGIRAVEQALAARAAKEIAGDSLRIAFAVRREVLRHYDEQAARRLSVEEDPVAREAFALLVDPKRYRALLGGR